MNITAHQNELSEDLREAVKRLETAGSAYRTLELIRNELIRRLAAEGKSLREIAALAMMSHTGVAKVLAR